MVALLAELRADAQTGSQRRGERRTLQLEVRASPPQDGSRALVHNLSERGLLVETAAAVEIGDIIELDLPQAGTSAARVVWITGSFLGCEFTNPLPRAAVSAALLLAPTQVPRPAGAIPGASAHASSADEEASFDHAARAQSTEVAATKRLHRNWQASSVDRFAAAALCLIAVGVYLLIGIATWLLGLDSDGHGILQAIGATIITAGLSRRF